MSNDFVAASHIEPSADVHPDASIDGGCTVWHLAQVREDARLGKECVVGRGAYIDAGVVLGARCKIQNYALVYAPATLESGVFIGPAAVLTNDRYPRAINADGTRKTADDWVMLGVTIRTGAAIGARSALLPGVTVGAWAMVAAGSVVTKDVADFAIVAGVPAQRVGWVGQAGLPLQQKGVGAWRCPQTHRTYIEKEDGLEERS